jgi:hypothetical protein
MKNKIVEILLIILLLDILLLAVSFVPGITIPFVNNDSLKLKFLSFESLTDFKIKDDNKSADSLINSYLSNDSIRTGKFHRTSLSGIGPKIKNNFLIIPQTGDEYALDYFFNALLKEKDETVVRIIHYGDSQLEGDRISCFVRDNFQKKFGGCGIGFVPLEDIADNMNLVRYSSPNWNRYTVFHNRYGCGFYGLSGNVYKFSKYAVIKNEKDTSTAKKDSSYQKVDPKKIYDNATVSISLGPQVLYSQISLMYGHSYYPCSMNVYNQWNNEKILSETLEPSEGFTVHKLGFPSSVRSFTLEFSGDYSPDFYGLLVDGSTGVQLDNYAIRGHSGDGLLLINPNYLAAQLKKLNVKLVIFQYGNNVVPFVNTDERCKEMEDMYYSLFMLYKNSIQGISILVIGTGDMATVIDGEFSSYPYIPKIIAAQKRAALKAGCAFYDLNGVMGGENSILTWTNKGLASHDGHFTNKGQKIIGNELFNALMIEYNQYKYRQSKKGNS